MSKKGFMPRLLGPLALLVLLTTACSGILVGGEEGQQQERGAPAAPAAGKGKELVVFGGEPLTLDPALTQWTFEAEFVVEIFSGLVRLNDKLQIVPDIAKSWDVSPDGKTYTFKLRDDVKFHDGKPVTARDFKFSLERAADPKTESTTVDLYLNDVVGVKDKLNGKAPEIKGVEVVDDHTLRITIDAPKPYFLAKLTYPVAFVVDKDNVAKSGWTDRPNGTGPFKLAEWKKGERIVLERNPLFYDGPPKLDRVRFLLAGGSAMTMYENDEVDVTGIPTVDLERVSDPDNPLSKEIMSSDNLDLFYLAFNTKQPPFDDVKVRQALAHAIDKETIYRVVYLGRYRVARGILPPGMPGYNQALKGLDFDPEKARELLAASKYKTPEGLGRIIYSVPGGGARLTRDTEAIVDNWKKNLGVEVEIQQIDEATFLQERNRGQLQLFQLGWSADYPDPENFLDLHFHSKSPENGSRYANPEVDRLLEQARVERDVAKRLRLYQQAEQIIVNEAPWVPLIHSRSYALVKPYVKGYKLNPMIIPFLKDVSIEK